MKSDYASVTDQAGIYAGDGGFVILRTLVKQEKMNYKKNVIFCHLVQ